MDTNRDNIALYAAVKTFHGKGHDMWSAIAALVLIIIPNEGSETDIKHDFSIQYQLEIPSDALKTALSRLKREKEIVYTQGFVKITESGKQRRVTLEKSVQDIRREYVLLSKDFREYMMNRHVPIAGDGSKILLDFIDDNIGFASEVVVSSQKNKGRATPSSAVADYIINIESSNPALFEILQNIFFGRLYMTLMKTRTEIDKNAKFHGLNVYFDTNVMLDILDLHDKDRHQSAMEMLDVFKEFNEGIRLAIFDETYEETINLLKSYVNAQDNFTEHIKVEHPLYMLKVRKVDREDLILLIETLDKKLEKLGIAIDSLPILAEEKYRDTRSHISKIVEEAEAQKSPYALNHDAKILEAIKTVRRKHRVKTDLLEKSKAIFITSDQSLFRYAKRDAASTNNFPLALRPIEVISLLWIKAIGSESKFSGNLLRHAVMGYARERLINHKLWEAFVNRLADAQSKGDISKEDIGVILAADETSKLLRSDQKDIIDKIVNQSYIDKLRTEQLELKQTNDNREEEIKNLKKKVLTSETKIKGERITRQSAEEKVDVASSSIAQFAHGTAVFFVNTVSLLLLLAFCSIFYFFLTSFGFDVIANILTLILFIGGISFAFMGKKVGYDSIVIVRKTCIKSLKEKLEKIARKKLFAEDILD